MQIAVLGAGAWGTSIAIALAGAGHGVTLVPRRSEHAFAIAQANENAAYLPGVAIPESLQLGHELLPVLMETEAVLLACPVKGLRALCTQLKESGALEKSTAWANPILLTLCKGLEPETCLTPTQVVASVLGENTPRGTLSGPSFAHEVAAGKPAALVLAAAENCADDARLSELQTALSTHTLRTYRSRDVRGVEFGGALKNIYALGAGLADGLQLGENAKAAYLTRALAELLAFASAEGAQPSTLYGLGGLGDLMLTCFGTSSRNRAFGQTVAMQQLSAQALEAHVANAAHSVEGYHALQPLHKLAQEHGIDTPLLNELHAVFYAGKAPAQALATLMQRGLKAE